ncbi:CPBP family intramembrane glutamic endopeptidase [Granulicella arctica]|uniref:CPBP family intramembrane glutamic endopeptidase n=1 Tax=Granulicella arctica TaxID=940613 RepID=UPI0021E087D1|nr:CPBP family intramembrane glutamic endopeptidase [Granulicella arctica]
MTNDTPAFEEAPILSAGRPLPPERNPIFFGPDGLRAGWSLLIYVALLAALVSVARLITVKVHHAPAAAHRTSGPHEQAPRSSYLNEGVPLLAVVLATWIMSRIERRPVGAYGFGGTRKVSRLFAGLGWGVAFLSLLVLVLRSTGLLVFDNRLLSGATILRYAAVWLGGFLLVALFEEYLLRGYVQFTLSRGFAGIFRALHPTNSKALGFWAAAFLLSFLFGLGHGSNPGESPIGLLSAGVAGLVFCLSLWRTGSLWWAIGFHTSWDWAQSFLYGVADSGTMVQFHLFATHAVGRPVLSGGLTGPEGSIYILPVMAAVAVAIILTLPRSAEPLLETI